MGLALAAPAYAQVTINPSTVAAGGTVDVSWDCGDDLHVKSINSGGILPSLEGSPWDGMHTENGVQVNPSAAPGTYPITIICADDAGVDQKTLNGTLTIPPPTSPKPSGAPKTGGGGSAPVGNVVIGGLALLGAAAAALILTRRAVEYGGRLRVEDTRYELGRLDERLGGEQ